MKDSPLMEFERAYFERKYTNMIAPLMAADMGRDLNRWCVSTWFYRKYAVTLTKFLWEAVGLTLIMLALMIGLGISF